MEKSSRKRTKVLFLAGLVISGIILGTIALQIINVTNTTDKWEFELEDGRLVLDAKDREHIKEVAIDATLKDESIKQLIGGKDYTTQVTLFGSIEFGRLWENLTVIPSATRVTIVSDEKLDTINVVVTITFNDGSGYNIPIDFKEWTVGEPEYSEKVKPPEENIRIEPPVTSREDFITSVFGE
jgi:hypothetical protein